MGLSVVEKNNDEVIHGIAQSGASYMPALISDQDAWDESGFATHVANLTEECKQLDSVRSH